MSRTVLTITELVPTGIGTMDLTTLEQAGTSDGHSLPNAAGDVAFYIRNSGAGPHVTTIRTPETVAGLAVAENTVTLATTKATICGPFARETFNQTDGYVYLDFDGTQSEVKVVAFRLTKQNT